MFTDYLPHDITGIHHQSVLSKVHQQHLGQQQRQQQSRSDKATTDNSSRTNDFAAVSAGSSSSTNNCISKSRECSNNINCSNMRRESRARALRLITDLSVHQQFGCRRCCSVVVVVVAAVVAVVVLVVVVIVAVACHCCCWMCQHGRHDEHQAAAADSISAAWMCFWFRSSWHNLADMQRWWSWKKNGLCSISAWLLLLLLFLWL